MTAPPDPGPAPAGARERFHEIDGLRALAITLVVTHHFVMGAVHRVLTDGGRPRLAEALGSVTASGVELFFVLSGIVLLRPYVRGTRPFRSSTYARRRVERLWPPYLAALLVTGLVLLVGWLWPTWYTYKNLPPFSVPSWARQLGIVAVGNAVYNPAWWSLTPELLFYTTAPLVVLVFAPRRMRGVWPWALFAAVAVSSVVWWGEASRPGVQPDAGAVARQFLTYAPCFTMGVILAKTDLPAAVGRALLAAGVAYFALGVLVPRANLHIAFALLYGGLVVLALRRPGRFGAQLSRPLPVWLGERSYSLFLVHYSVWFLCGYLASLAFADNSVAYQLVTRASAVVGSLLAAMIVFWWVERRFARNLASARAFWPWQFRDPPPPPPVAAAASAPGAPDPLGAPAA